MKPNILYNYSWPGSLEGGNKVSLLIVCLNLNINYGEFQSIISLFKPTVVKLFEIQIHMKYSVTYVYHKCQGTANFGSIRTIICSAF